MREKLCGNCGVTKPINQFYNQSDRKSRYTWCKACFSAYCTKRWINRKLAAIHDKGDECYRCKLKLADSHYSVFEFHHPDPTVKEYSWTKLRLQSIATVEKELRKCVLVCANCHRLLHVEMREAEVR